MAARRRVHINPIDGSARVEGSAHARDTYVSANDTVFCPNPTPGGSCYFYYSTSRSFADAKAQCQSVYNGNLVSLNSEYEQRLLESRFRTTSDLGIAVGSYWLGLNYSADTFLYEWPDGEDAGSGPPSEYPYAHFVYNFQDLKGTYPSWMCTAALSSVYYDRQVGRCAIHTACVPHARATSLAQLHSQIW